MVRHVLRAAGLAALALWAAGVASAADAPALPGAVSALQPGLWEFRTVGDGSAPARRCVSDLRELFQPRQPGALCRQFVAQDETDRAIVTYDCAARGRGRTELRVETPRLLSIESQGIIEGMPFAARMEARRVGACIATNR